MSSTLTSAVVYREGPTYALALGELHEEVIFVPELLERLDILLNQQSILQRL